MKQTIITIFLSVLTFVLCACSGDGITDTYWRDDKTGEWLIGLTEDKLFYDCKAWDIASKDESNGAYALQANDGLDKLSVSFGTEQDGKRTVTIGGKQYDCSLIDGWCLPDYPKKDPCDTIADNHYVAGDSVTIEGWIVNRLPGIFSRIGKVLGKDEKNTKKVTVEMMANILTDEELTFTAPIDSVGHFTLRMPIVNTTSFLLDCGRKNVSVVAEPNETYFLTIDELQGKVLFMGKNARLQNEVRAHHIRMNGYGSDQLEAIGDFTAILDSIRTQTKAELRELDAVCHEHPTLSGRYRTYYRNSILANGMSNLMRAKFLAPNYELPETYMKAVEEDYWQKLAEPYTLEAYTFTYFFNNYSEQLQQKARSKIDYTLKWIVNQAEKDGIVSLSAREREAAAQYDASFPAYDEKLKSAPDSLRQAINAEFEQNDFVAVVNEIISREGYQDYANTKFTQRDLAYLLPEMNAQGWSQATQDIFLSRYFCHLLRGECKPLDKSLLAFAEEHIHAPAALSAVRALSDKYEQLTHFMLDNEDCFKSNDIVKGMSDGEAIFQKIIEPYRGRVILVDVWGTWCGPCKAQLSHCQEEYERLKDYDVVYLYLANRSSDQGWKNVVKEYQVAGKNVVHYNLPEHQQKAVEEYLGVQGFPTNIVFGRDGKLHKVLDFPLDIEAVAGLLEKM